MSKKSEIVGYIYILDNGTYVEETKDVFKKKIKIGYCDTDELDNRVRNLSNKTCTHEKFHIYAIYGVHKRLADNELWEIIKCLNQEIRPNPKREFYIMTPQTAYKILESIAKMNGLEKNLIRNPKNDDYFSERYKENNTDNLVGEILHLKGKHQDIEIISTEDGKYILPVGSQIEPKDFNKPKLKNAEQLVKNTRDKYKDSFNNQTFVTTKDIIFDRPSQIAKFISGNNISGPANLINKDGKSLNELKTN